MAGGDAFASIELNVFETYLAVSTQDLFLRTDGTAMLRSTASGTLTAVPGIKWRSLANATSCGLAADSTAVCVANDGIVSRIWGQAKWSTITGQQNARLCALDFNGAVWCGSASSAPTQQSGSPAIVTLGTFGPTYPNWEQFNYPGYPCGLTVAGDLYCFDKEAPRLMNLGGIQLKQFSTWCGIATDGFTYCWDYAFTQADGTRPDVGARHLLPGQR
jgi:hypothetical protein